MVALTATVACAPPVPESTLGQDLEVVVRQAHETIDSREVNTCNGESVLLTGEVHIVVTEKASARQGHINGHLTGTGSAGNDYVLNLQGRTSVEAGTVIVEFVGRQLLISKGGAPNQMTTVAIMSDPFSMTVQVDCRG